ncbi:ATP-binding protein [Treponema sp.]|uniref:sensor histidine kinase n=1 Tax=Treponema sp. TaxID=166 RepID=UPI0025EE8EB4|nr:ATP-binding protein [Treponema sp.]MCR5218009.1 two-component sensor histidine kinase [Treponema sp.]
MNEFFKKASSKISKLSPEQLTSLIEALYSENNSFHSILESLSTGLIITDNDWHIIQKNKAADRLLQLKHRSSDSLESSIVWDCIETEEIASFLRNASNNKNTNISDEFSIPTESGVRFVTVSVLPLVQKNVQDKTKVCTLITGSIITVDDITSKRQQEIILHRMESLASLTNLAASVAHEIKNPLGAISIHIQLLQKAVKKARAGDGLLPQPKFMENYLDVVNEEISNLNKIVLDFLFAVRPVHSNMELTDADKIVEKTADFFIPQFKENGVELETRLCHKEQRLLIDEKLFREVLINILQNALHAINSSKKSDGRVLILSECDEEKYILKLRDNGCGMDENTASHVFEPYYTTKADGTGLGLTMAYKVIKEFRGDISVDSEAGKGTEFTITIPVPQKDTKLLGEK